MQAALFPYTTPTLLLCLLFSHIQEIARETIYSLSLCVCLNIFLIKNVLIYTLNVMALTEEKTTLHAQKERLSDDHVDDSKPRLKGMAMVL